MSQLSKSGPVVSSPRPPSGASLSPAAQTTEAVGLFLHEVPPSPNPLPPPPLSPLPSSADNNSRVASTAPTQLVRRGTSSDSPLSSDDDGDIRSRFLLYNAAGRLVGAREPTDPWGVLVSEHTTLNCIYKHRTVRVGREEGCDATLRNALVSTTHFTISLELEPYEPHDGISGSNGGGPTEHAEEAESTKGGSLQSRPTQKLLQDADTATASTTDASHVVEGSEESSQERGPLSTSTAVPLSPHDVGLPGWRVHRVLLTDCSANGTYINDELVGRGHYRMLHSGDDINIVRVPEATCQGGASPSPPVQSYVTARSSSRESAEGVDEEPRTTLVGPNEKSDEFANKESWIRQRRRALRELNRQHPTAPNATSVAATVAKRRRRRAHDGGDDDDDEESASAQTKEDLEKTQMFTALLSTLSTKYTYLERFCFHMYNTEEPQQQQQQHGTAATGNVLLDPRNYTAPSTQQNFDVVGMERGEEGTEQETWNRQKEPRESAQRDTAVFPKPLSVTSLREEKEVTTSVAGVATVPHQRAVRFVNIPETVMDVAQTEADSGNLASSAQSKGTSTTVADVALPPLLPSSNSSGALTTPAGPPRNLTARQEQAVSTLVTPFSLLRSRPSIRTSFIAPITLSERESSTTSSAGSAVHHQQQVHAPTSSTAATRFHESLSISPALQREAAAQQRADARRAHDNRALASSNDGNNRNTNRADVGGAFGGLLKDGPADIPIRYAVLPLRHLQWGGRIGCGASGEVYMGIDVSTATAVAIKVLKGGSLFPPAEATKVMSTATEVHGGGGGGAGPSAEQSPAIRPDEDTLLSLSNVSLGNTPPTSRSSSGGSVSASTAPATTLPDPSSCTTSKGSPFEVKDGKGEDDEEAPPEKTETEKRTAASASRATREAKVDGQREEEAEAYANEESAPFAAAATPPSPASSSVNNTPPECGRRPSTALVTSTGSGKSVLAPQKQQPQRQRQREGPQATRPSAPPIIRKHFREIVFLTTLQHQRIVRFLGFQFSVDGRLCLLMEYVAGGTLQTLIRNFGAFEENVIRLYTLQILEGMEYLTRKGVVHGDLKSANILVSEQGSVKLTDFGTSRFVHECTTDELPTEKSTHRTGASQQHTRRCSPTHQTGSSAHHHGAQGDGTDANAPQHSALQEHGNEEVGEEEKERMKRHRTRSGSRDEESKREKDDNVFSREHSDVYSGDAAEADEEEDDDNEGDASRQRVLCGTPLYMSPELIRTQEPSFASDVWALGCVVYEMATGGLLPWRPVHQSNASAVIWYIGQRQSASEGPPLDDVYAERERLNHAAMHRSRDAAEGFEMEEYHHNSDGDEESNEQQHGGGWSVTPSPMLIDLLQCTLNMDAADRPSAAELLQHPFIRGENSIAALEKWHAAVAAKHRALAAKSVPQSLRGGFEEYSDEKTGGSDDSSNGGRQNDDERRRSRNSTRSSTGSPFETAVLVSGSSSSGTAARKAITPPHGTPSWPAQTSVSPSQHLPLQQRQRVEELVDVDVGGWDVKRKDDTDDPHSSHALADQSKQREGRKSRSSSTTTSPPPSLSAPPQPTPSILVKPSASPPPGGRVKSSTGKSNTPTSFFLGDSWEKVKPLSLVSGAPAPPPPTAAPLTPLHPQQEVPQSNNAERPSVLGEGNPDSQPLIDEPPHPTEATGRRTGFWGKIGRRDNALPSGTAESTQVPPPLPFSSTASPSPQLPHASYSGGNLPAQPMSQLFSSTAPQFKVPLPRSQTHASPGISQQQQQHYTAPSSQPSDNFPRSMIAAHQIFLRKKEQERRSSSLAPLQPSRQLRGRPRTEGWLPTYNTATHQSQQGSVLGSSRGYSFQNPQLSTQTMEMHVPLRFASQPTPSGSGRYRQQQQQHGNSHGGKRKARMGGATASQNQSSQNTQQQQPFNAPRHKSWNVNPNAKLNNYQDYTSGGGGGSVVPNAAVEGTNLSRNDIATARSPRGPRPQSDSVLGGNTDSNSRSDPQHANYLPPQMGLAWKPGELTLEMDRMTLNSPRTGATPASASAYAGSVLQGARFVMPSSGGGGGSSKHNNISNGVMLTPAQQPQMQAPGSPAFSSGGNMAPNNPASPLVYTTKDTTPVLGEGSRPRRHFLARRRRGGRRSSQERRQNLAAAQVHQGLTEGPAPRRSSIGSLRQRRRGNGRQVNQHGAFGRQGDGGGGGDGGGRSNNNNNNTSGVFQQTNSEGKSAVLPSPPPPLDTAPTPSVRAEGQRNTAQRASPDSFSATASSGQAQSMKRGERQGVTRSRSSLRGRNAAKQAPRERSKRGK
ncbi:putative protein kinase [Leptomonas pyrrhocoris]|uniref:Protein kinase n=1 Tax=Leptomonas pyrrhocoris TaxID=157538 RepID=A0A0M9FV92_LEPPY|nr:putative protein kinase [Leptomonas pyrrhocoris]KPA76586.1 putative protein kinase [Leptomonas pyrrhocoris]|eukprot:XP_015655025.1 putative protein kinase [Leptomonas pyrrhocoris]